jgi:hypothetical protein
MVIGITINNIVRDHISKLAEAYEFITENEPILPINPFDLEPSFPTKIQEIDVIELSASNIDNEHQLMPMDKADESFDVYEFMYMDASFEVFGRCNQTENNLIANLSKLKDETTEVVLLNKESSRSKCATLFFLSKNNFDLNKIIFPDNYEDFYKNCDVLVTDNPKLLELPHENRIVVKIKNDFNIDYDADFTIIKLSEIFDIIDQIKNKFENTKN